MGRRQPLRPVSARLAFRLQSARIRAARRDFFSRRFSRSSCHFVATRFAPDERHELAHERLILGVIAPGPFA